MSIRAKLQLSMLIQIILVFIVGTVLVSALHAINRANEQNVRAARINESITEIRFVTFENLLTHNQRSLEQWQSKYQTIAGMLEPKSTDSPAEHQLLTNMASQHHEIKSLFDRLTASYDEASTNQAALNPTHFQERLVGQLLVRQQAQIAEATKLAALAGAEIKAQQVSSLWLVLGVIVIMLLATATNAWIINTTITTSLATLGQGAAAIAAGNLDYRIQRPRKDEFGHLAAAFNTMAASLKQIEQTKSEFILMVSHQLRTPATAVKGFLSLLVDGYQGKLSPGQTDTLKSAFAENERQLELVDEMLVVAQAETGEMVLSKSSTDLAKVVDDIIAAQSPLLQAHAQTIAVNQPKTLPKLLVDPEKLRIVLENLITNASNYSPDNTPITITLKATATEITIEVKDKGFGIPKQDLGKLFQKFSRLTNTGTTRIEGAGLGLYLAKKIIDLHHGKIKVSSVVGQGSSFTVHLPLASD